MDNQIQQPEPQKNLEAFKALLEIETKEKSVKLKQNYYRAYVLSILFPPLGVYYFFKYIFFANGTDEDRKAGLISLVVTTVSLLLSLWIFDLFFKGMSTAIPNQDTNFLKELITPKNQKDLNNLLR